MNAIYISVIVVAVCLILYALFRLVMWRNFVRIVAWLFYPVTSLQVFEPREQFVQRWSDRRWRVVAQYTLSSYVRFRANHHVPFYQPRFDRFWMLVKHNIRRVNHQAFWRYFDRAVLRDPIETIGLRMELRFRIKERGWVFNLLAGIGIAMRLQHHYQQDARARRFMDRFGLGRCMRQSIAAEEKYQQHQLEMDQRATASSFGDDKFRETLRLLMSAERISSYVDALTERISEQAKERHED